MLDNRGDNGPPCGVPSLLGVMMPPSNSPACRYLRMRCSTRLSLIFLANRDIRMSWLTRSKNLASVHPETLDLARRGVPAADGLLRCRFRQVDFSVLSRSFSIQ